MFLFSFILSLIVFPAGIVAIGVITRKHSWYLTLACGALFGVAIYLMVLLACWDLKLDILSTDTASTKAHWGRQIYEVVATPVLAALLSLAVRACTKILVR